MTPAERARHELRKQIIEEGEKGNWKPLYDARAKGPRRLWSGESSGYPPIRIL